MWRLYLTFQGTCRITGALSEGVRQIATLADGSSSEEELKDGMGQTLCPVEQRKRCSILKRPQALSERQAANAILSAGGYDWRKDKSKCPSV